jgi:hypothetical protein
MAETVPGLSLPTPTLAAPLPPANMHFSVANQANLSLAALQSLGLVSDRAGAVDYVTENFQVLHDSLGAEPRPTELEPFFAIELSERFVLRSLVKAFDAKQHGHDSRIYDQLWNHESAELNARHVGQKAVAASDGGLTGNARAMLLGGHHDHEEGLYHINRSARQQASAANVDALINPADYIMLNAQRREAGHDPLDTGTYTRFVQLGRKPWEGSIYVPSADWDGDHLRLRGSTGGAGPASGVRLSVGPQPKA